MLSLESTKAWISENRDLCVEALRIYLGIGLFFKGLNFVFSDQALDNMIVGPPQDLPVFDFLDIHFIVLAHIIGGLLLTFGLLTRLAAVIQIPILFGAVLFVTWPQGVFEILELSMLVLFLLIFFTIYGSGRFSVDAVLAKRSK